MKPGLMPNNGFLDHLVLCASNCFDVFRFVSYDVWNKTTFGPKVEKTFLWSLEAFKERIKSFEDGEMLSTFFSLRGPEECVTKWQLDLYPKPNTGSLVL